MSALSSAASSGKSRTQGQPPMSVFENDSKVASFDYTSCRTETITITGAAVNAAVIVNPRTALLSGLGIGYSYVNAANSVKINITNSGISQALGTVVFDITIIQ